MDLYHRLSVILIHVPTLNERKDDIGLLADKFCADICVDYGIAKKEITPKALSLLKEYNYTGNIRELRNIVERLVILSGTKITEVEVTNFASNGDQKPKYTLNSNVDMTGYTSFNDFRDQMEKKYLKHILDSNNWNMTKAAEIMDIQRSQLYNKCEKYNLKKEME
jgi:two-component system, NtrC family, nitrogen regulation response regulator NtrX